MHTFENLLRIFMRLLFHTEVIFWGLKAAENRSSFSL